MQAHAPYGKRSDGSLWLTAFGLSVVANIVVLGIVGQWALRSALLNPPTPVATPPEATVVAIFPEIVAEPDLPAEAEPDSPQRRFARTAADQQATAPPKNAAFIGERDTIATSDRAPDAAAPPLPSQKGVEPRNVEDLETTEGDFRDGPMTAATTPMPPQAEAAPAAAPPPAPTPVQPATPDAAAPPPAEQLLQGPDPVDVSVPNKPEIAEAIKPTPPTPKQPTPDIAELPKPPAAKPIPDDPAFSGYQRKAAVVGSISRTGRSALNVADSALGRYQAAISRAVELEWQRNCVRHRDFITPGFLTVRFFVEPNGQVRTVRFVGEMTTGEVQKGFTLSSIRDADIPAMPSALKKEYAKEPLELIFNFYF